MAGARPAVQPHAKPVGWSGSGAALSPPPSEPYVRLSSHTAQASPNALFTGRGFDTFQPRLCICRWQLGCISTRLSGVSAPPSIRGRIAKDSARVLAGGRSLLYTGGALSATDDASPPVPGPSPLDPGVSALWAVQHLPPVLTLDACGGSLEPALSRAEGLTIPRHPGRLNRLVLAVTVSAHASTAVLPACPELAEGTWRLCPQGFAPRRCQRRTPG